MKKLHTTPDTLGDRALNRLLLSYTFLAVAVPIAMGHVYLFYVANFAV